MKEYPPFRKRFIVFALFAFCCRGCAASHDRTDDGYQDASADTDSDVDTDEECQDDECLNSELPCCMPEGCELKPAGEVCDEEYKTEYSCRSDEPECGSAIYVHYQKQLCDGLSPYCKGEITDWGDWEIDRTCRPFEVCWEDDSGYFSFEEGIKCVSKVGKCPVEFDDLVCFEGGDMPDCEETGCPDPLPSLIQSVEFSKVAAGQPGEVVLLELFVSDRVSIGETIEETIPPKPFNDIRGVLSLNGHTVPFYNHYAAEHSYSDWFGERYRFPVQWRLPQLWGETLSGTWELSFEDSGFSGPEDEPLAFALEQWCLRFINPEFTVVETENKEWKAEYSPTFENPIGFIEPGDNYFEIHINDIFRADDATPVLHLDIDHDDPSSIFIELTASNGLVIPIKDKDAECVPESTELPDLSGEWLTGRYQLKIASDSAGAPATNKVTAWSISADMP